MAANETGRRAADGADNWHMAEHWPDLVVAVTEQSVQTVSLLQRGLDLLLQKGRLSPAEHKVLALPAERLKQCGMTAQQIIRFQSGRVRQTHERIDLAYLLECVLQERRAELALQGITVRRKFRPVDVLVDPTLGFTLAKAMLDWSLRFGSRVDVRLDASGEPLQARLWMKTHAEPAPAASAVFDDGIEWLLLRQVAASDGAIAVERAALPDGVELTATLRRGVAAPAPAPASGDVPSRFETVGQTAMPDAPETAFRTITNAYVLVLSADQPLRLECLEILRRLGISVDGVASPAQALDALRGREAHLVVVDESLPEAERTILRSTLQRTWPQMPVLGIAAAGTPAAADTSEGGDRPPLVRRETLLKDLGSTVMFTLSRVM